MKLQNVEDIYPLSPLQEGLLFHSLYAPGSGIYCEQMGITLRSSIDLPTFKQAWQYLLARHTILRSAFVWESLPTPLQVVRKHVDLPWQELDLQGLSAADQDERIKALYKADRDRGFDPEHAPLMRLTLLQLSPIAFHLLWSHHHLLLDGQSVALLLNELFHVYAALQHNSRPALPPPRPYRNYISWLEQQNQAEARAFWTSCLAGFSVSTPLPGAQSRSRHTGDTEEGGEYAEVSLALSHEQNGALQDFLRRHRLTLNTLLQGAWALLLSRYSGEADVLFGTTVSTRPARLPGAERLIGLLINTLPSRVRVIGQEHVLPWLQTLQSTLAEARQYDYSSLLQVQQWSQIPRGQALFESLLVVENYALETLEEDPHIPSQSPITGLQFSVERTNYPLVISAAPGAALLLRLSYERGRFSETESRRIIGHYRTLLTELILSPDRPLYTLSMLTRAEKDQISHYWMGEKAEYSDYRSLYRLFEEQALHTPEAIALVYQESQLTYKELESRTARLASLLHERGIGPETLVALCLERSPELVIGMLGILKAGGCYMPLDPNQPAGRLDFLLRDSRASFLLTRQTLAKRVSVKSAQRLFIEKLVQEEISQEQRSRLPDASPEQLTYLIYTSGSTGTPKGVAVSGRAIVNHMYWMQKHFPLTEKDRVLQKTPLTFDASVWEFYAPLLAGGRLVLTRQEGERDASYLCQIIQEQAITRLQVVPTLLRYLMAEGLTACASLEQLFCGGEPLVDELAAAWTSQSGAALHNLYGPTEATIDTTCWTAEPHASEQHVSLGRPVTNVAVYILDGSLQPVPIGVPGELYIGGAGLARGYLHHPELTAERFLPDPLGEQRGGRLYCTGDLGRYLPDGTIEYIGRLDQQVKVRGFRIEPGEIEAVLGEHPAIQEAVVVARTDPPHEKRLIAYVVAPQQEGLSASLRAYLKAHLPDYMIPTTFVRLGALPLTSHGKVDRRALPAPEAVECKPEPAAPRNAIETDLASIWSELLGLKQVDIHANFFELGGHSLLATRVTSRIREVFHLDLPLRVIFDAPTIAEQAEIIVLQQLEEADPAILEGLLGAREER